MKKLFLLLFLIFALNSCGGGGGSSDVAANNTTTPPNNNSVVPADPNNTTTPPNNNSVVPADPNNTTTPPNNNSVITADRLYSSFHVGFGDSGSFGFEGNSQEVVWLSVGDLVGEAPISQNSHYQDIKNFNAPQFDYLQQKLKNSKYIVSWMVMHYWQENWYNIEKLQSMMDQGYVPVFAYWYFADALSGGLPNDNLIQEYYKDNIRLAKLLQQLKGTKIVIMEPEFNKNTVTDSQANQEKFASIISNAIDTIKNNTQDVLFSLSMMDTGNRGVDELYTKCGYDSCALGDQSEWAKPEIVYNALKDKLDFISFSQMAGQFSRDAQKPDKYRTYTNNEAGIDYLAQRINNMSSFLHQKYNKPIFMPYITIGTATWEDFNQNSAVEYNELNLNGWEDEANSVYLKLMNSKEELVQNGLFGFAIMSLFDDPQHDINGYQYFSFDEYHFGIVKTSAIDEKSLYRLGDIVFKQNIVDTVFSLD